MEGSIKSNGGLDKGSNRSKSSALTIALSVIILGIILFSLYLISNRITGGALPKTKISDTVDQTSKNEFKLSKFKSTQEFKEYMKGSRYDGNLYGYGGVSDLMLSPDSPFTTSTFDALEKSAPQIVPETGGGVGSNQFDVTSPSYQSNTNVQVLGIDEADIVKHDGRNIFYARENQNRYYAPMVEPMIDNQRIIDPGMPPERFQSNQIEVIKAFPPKNLSKASSIQDYGNMYYFDDYLVVLKDDGVSAYLVSNPSLPVKKWDYAYKGNSRLVESRLYGKDLFLVLQNNYDSSSPCPIVAFEANGSSKSISCTDIYHPYKKVNSNSIYTVLKVDPKTGDINDEISFVGGRDYGNIIYMSPNHLYVAYNYTYSQSQFYMDFIMSEARSIFPAETITRLEEINAYNISEESKMIEFTTLFENYMSSLDEDARKKLELDLENKVEEYAKKSKSSTVNTGLFKIDIDNLDIGSYGYVPGMLLNQFSLDEYEGNLRVATTLENFGTDSSNAVFVLDKNLDMAGHVGNMGTTEKIYSARFIGDKGYLVTFRQIDPFYVLDLSNPTNPLLKGELKIPGYSSYLHPLKDNLILGVGMEANQVKISLFDVKDPSNPQELSTYKLDEYSSDILQTHRAFTHDPRKQVFFIPGQNGGYIFSYVGNKLSLEKAVNEQNVDRSVILDNYLYILSNDKVVVLDENNWERVSEIGF